MFGIVFLWEVCQVIWWTFNIGGCDGLITDFFALTTGVVCAAQAPLVTMEWFWRFFFLFTKCDEEVRCTEFGMTRCIGVDEVCSECLANRTHRPFTDMRSDAVWRFTKGYHSILYKVRSKRPLHALSSKDVRLQLINTMCDE